MPQLTLDEQSFARVMFSQKKSPIEIHGLLVEKRKKIVAKEKGQGTKAPGRFAKKGRKKTKKAVGPDLTTVRRFLHGKSHQAFVPETRGRKRTYTRRAVLDRSLTLM